MRQAIAGRSGLPAGRQGVSGWRRSLEVYGNRRVMLILPLGFASGLPLLLTFSTLSAWLATAGVSRAAIGAFALVGTPYAFKFVWSPLIDRLPPPLPLGRRCGWGIVIQILLIAAIARSWIRAIPGGPRSDGRVGADGRVSLGESGHRNRRVASRDPHARTTGPGRRDDPDRIPHRDAGLGSRRADCRRAGRMVRRLRHDGGVVGRWECLSSFSVPSRPYRQRRRIAAEPEHGTRFDTGSPRR